MTDERLDILNKLRQEISDLETIITDLETAECPAIMNCDWETGNHDMILDLRDYSALLEATKLYLERALEAKRKKFEEG